VLFVFIVTDALAFGDRDVEVFFRLRRLHIEEIRTLSRPHALREDLIFVAVVLFQCPHPPLQGILVYDGVWWFDVGRGAYGAAPDRGGDASALSYFRNTATFPFATWVPSSDAATTI
jgi:hypothetical protein